MFDSLFKSIIGDAGSIKGTEYLICSLVALAMGLVVAFVHMYKNTYSKNIIVTLVVLPYILMTMLMIVNGSIGIGVAVVGTFSLIRFRSAQGNAKEIMSILYALTLGLALSRGYIGVAVFILIFVGVVVIVLSLIDFGVKKSGDRTLKVTIPEDLDFEGIFDEIFDKYTTKADVLKCRTTNMGSLYEITYDIILKKDVSEKAFIDELRTRNGNLTIVCGRPITPKDDL